jgi:hypothetical protein
MRDAGLTRVADELGRVLLCSALSVARRAASSNANSGSVLSQLQSRRALVWLRRALGATLSTLGGFRHCPTHAEAARLREKVGALVAAVAGCHALELRSVDRESASAMNAEGAVLPSGRRLSNDSAQ